MQRIGGCKLILSDVDILKELDNGNIICKPFVRPNLSVSSIDLRLGSTLIRHPKPRNRGVRFDIVENGRLTVVGQPKPRVFDLTHSPYILHPGDFILGSTLEYAGSNSDRIIAQVLDKSTLARLGVSICFSAGFIDPGNSLNITLEIKNHGHCPIELRSGMQICQVQFQYLNSPASQKYSGKYINSTQTEAAK